MYVCVCVSIVMQLSVQCQVSNISACVCICIHALLCAPNSALFPTKTGTRPECASEADVVSTSTGMCVRSGE
jgi:hypothetical protein